MNQSYFWHLFVQVMFGIVLISKAFGQKVPSYAKVEVSVRQPADIEYLADLGFVLDHYSGDPKSAIQFYVKHDELDILKTSGLAFKIVIEDFQKFYEKRQLEDQVNLINLSKKKSTANNFGFGSMGGFYTLAEVESQLDLMRTMYPNLITAKTSIGTSHEGRPIWSVMISDNPDVQETEPAVYYDALHHAREPLSMASTINYMFWLLENYGTDPAATYIINERQLYFVPVVNPDGYEYNRITNPNGGGFWRKNRRVNVGGSCIGVDLNRNYGYLWQNGATSSCSSTNSCSEVYRGTSAFSEPESTAVRDFLEEINPAVLSSLHSTVGNFILPTTELPDVLEFDLYSDWSIDFLDQNEYPFGTVTEMLGYSACGGAISYHNHEGIYSWTPEVDGSGFWPAQSEIFDLVDGMLYPLFYQAWISGAYARIQSVDQRSDAYRGSSFDLVVHLRNKGLNQVASDVTVTVVPSDPAIQVSGPVQFAGIPAQSFAANNSSPFVISIPSTYTNNEFQLDVISTQGGAETSRESIIICIGTRDILFSDGAENGLINWTTLGNGSLWSTCNDDFYTGALSFCDSENRNSENSTLNELMLNRTIDLRGTMNPKLCFFAKWSLEDTFDVVMLEVTSDGGASWTSIDTFTKNQKWAQFCYDLSQYKNSSQVSFRFVLQTDGFLASDGFYFDDFIVLDIDGSSCSDGIQNGDEVDIDCGGASCPACPCDDDDFVLNQLTSDLSAHYNVSINSNGNGSFISNNSKVSLSAGHRIVLNPNFEIEQGSVVHFYIAECQ